MKKVCFLLLLLLYGTFLCAANEVANLKGFSASDWTTDGATLYIGKDGDIYKSTDHGTTFTNIYTIPVLRTENQVIPSTVVWSLIIPNRIIGETKDRLLTSRANSGAIYMCTDLTVETPVFTKVLEIIHESGYVPGTYDGTFLEMTEDAAGNLYAGFYCQDFTNYQAKVYKSTDRGSNWSLIKTFEGHHIHYIKVNPYNDWLYAFVGEGGLGGGSDWSSLYRSKDGGSTWYKIFSGWHYWGSGIYDYLNFIPFNFINNVIYLGSESLSGSAPYSQIWRITDTGADTLFTPTSVYSVSSYGNCFQGATKVNGKLIFATSAIYSLAATIICVSSSDGTNWTLENSTTDNANIRALGEQTYHASRYGRTFYSLSPTTGYYFDSPDPNPPTVTILTSDPQATNQNSISVSWTDSDNVGVTSRKWRIGSAPDGSNGTECTSPATVTGLNGGANTVYIGAGDAAGNWGSDSITVNYTPINISGGKLTGGKTQ